MSGPFVLNNTPPNRTAYQQAYDVVVNDPELVVWFGHLCRRDMPDSFYLWVAHATFTDLVDYAQAQHAHDGRILKLLERMD